MVVKNSKHKKKNVPAIVAITLICYKRQFFVYILTETNLKSDVIVHTFLGK